MESQSNAVIEQQSRQKTRIKFYGKGSKFFGITIVNAILTVITLGLYYPWAKEKVRKYMWNESEVKNSRFVFHGTGKEMFKGFLIAYLIIGGLYLGVLWSSQHGDIAIYFLLAFYIAIIFIAPLAIFGAWRYRVTRTSWRGVYFGFDGVLRDFIKLYFSCLGLSIITLGIYTPWMRVRIMNFLFGHTQLGKNRFGFEGEGLTLLGINIFGVFLSIITFYIYMPFYIKNRINFTINNVSVDSGEEDMKLKSTLSGNEAFETLFVNALLIVFTFGLAFPWVMMRNMRMVLENIIIPDNLDFDSLEQSPNAYVNATGDEMVDILDIGLDF